MNPHRTPAQPPADRTVSPDVGKTAVARIRLLQIRLTIIVIGTAITTLLLVLACAIGPGFLGAILALSALLTCVATVAAAAAYPYIKQWCRKLREDFATARAFKREQKEDATAARVEDEAPR